MKKTLFVLALMAVSVFGVMAQEAPKYSEADYKSVYDLFDVMKLDEQMKNTTAKMLDIQMRTRPDIAPYREELTKFMDKYVSFQALKKDLAEIYLKHFTIDDIKGLTAFYQTPLGKKFAEKNSELANDSVELTTRKVAENQADLQKMIMEKNQASAK